MKVQVCRATVKPLQLARQQALRAGDLRVIRRVTAANRKLLFGLYPVGDRPVGPCPSVGPAANRVVAWRTANVLRDPRSKAQTRFKSGQSCLTLFSRASRGEAFQNVKHDGTMSKLQYCEGGALW